MEQKSMMGSPISHSEMPEALEQGYAVYADDTGQLRRVMMTLGLNDYQQLASRTAKELPAQQRFWHGCQGVASDGGELLTISKANQFYGKPIDHQHAIEKLGDVLWFVSETCNGLGIPLSLVALSNIDKLKKRYPEKYTDALAIERLDKK